MSAGSNLEMPSVQYRLKNLGPLEEAVLELGDLTIIAGRNNTGKTYLAYTLYGFMKAWNNWPGADEYFLSEKKSSEVTKLIKETVSEGHSKRLVDRHTLSLEREELLPILTLDFSRGALASVFSSPHEAFESTRLEITAGSSFPDVPEIEVQMRGDKVFTVEYDGSEIHMSCSDPEEESTDEFWLSILYLRFLLHDLFPEPIVLCAERFGISLFYKELDFTKNRLVEILQKLGDEKGRDNFSPFDLVEGLSSRYALPIKDNIDFTRDLSNLQKEKSDIHELRLFDDIKNMMEGYYRSTSDEVRFISKARKLNSFNIPLHRASSSARGLSELYFFLRHSAQRHQILIVDEPESHLDTANQIELARLLARLVRSGVKVLITTHSDYLIKELNNLIMLSKSFENKDSIAKRLKYRKDDFLHADSVRAYVAENNSLTPCTIDEFGIDMPFFDKTIEDINKVSNELATIIGRQEGV